MMNAMRLFQLVRSSLPLRSPRLPSPRPTTPVSAPSSTPATHGSFKDREAAAGALAATEDPRAVAVLQSLIDGDLYVVETSGKVLLGDGADAIDPVTGAVFAGAAESRDRKGQGQ